MAEQRTPPALRTEHCGPLSDEGFTIYSQIAGVLTPIMEELIGLGFQPHEVVGMIATEAGGIAASISLQTRFAMKEK